jgi:hypothetical protein
LGKEALAAKLSREDYDGLCELARTRPGKVLRYLTGRLYSADEEEKWRAVRAMGRVANDREILGSGKVEDLLRRFFWSLNDESGVVPFGVPEAIGELLARRPEWQEQFLPVLCSMVTHEDMLQTGPVERGVYWALGRVGEPVARCSPAAVKGVAAAASNHPDEQTRKTAEWALAQIRGDHTVGTCEVAPIPPRG